MGEADISAEQSQTRQESWVSSPDVDPGGPRHPAVPPAQGSASPVGLIWRIRDRQTFLQLRRDGRRFRRGPITITFVDGAPDGPPRVAFAVGRKAGGAVVRNRLRRRLRAVFADRASSLRPGAYLISAAPAAADMTFGELRNTVSEALGLPEMPR